jgi:hypothetical protein
MRQKASVLKLEGRQSEQEIRNAFLAQITAKCAAEDSTHRLPNRRKVPYCVRVPG